VHEKTKNIDKQQTFLPFFTPLKEFRGLTAIGPFDLLTLCNFLANGGWFWKPLTRRVEKATPAKRASLD
jgi:hypothetical protein